MPANTNAIPPRKEPTGQTQLPCKPPNQFLKHLTC